jgi:hypothetical protein
VSDLQEAEPIRDCRQPSATGDVEEDEKLGDVALGRRG